MARSGSRRKKKRIPGDYEVGYGKPPRHTQFKKGQSGNPGGRPSPEKADAASLAATLNQPLQVRRGDRVSKMQAFEASLKRLVDRAINRKDLSAALTFLELCQRHGVIALPEKGWQGGPLEIPFYSEAWWDMTDPTGVIRAQVDFSKFGVEPPPYKGRNK